MSQNRRCAVSGWRATARPILHPIALNDAGRRPRIAPIKWDEGRRPGIKGGARPLVVAHQLVNRTHTDPWCPDHTWAAEASGIRARLDARPAGVVSARRAP